MQRRGEGAKQVVRRYRLDSSNNDHQCERDRNWPSTSSQERNQVHARVAWLIDSLFPYPVKHTLLHPHVTNPLISSANTGNAEIKVGPRG